MNKNINKLGVILLSLMTITACGNENDSKDNTKQETKIEQSVDETQDTQEESESQKESKPEKENPKETTDDEPVVSDNIKKGDEILEKILAEKAIIDIEGESKTAPTTVKELEESFELEKIEDEDTESIEVVNKYKTKNGEEFRANVSADREELYGFAGFSDNLEMSMPYGIKTSDTYEEVKDKLKDGLNLTINTQENPEMDIIMFAAEDKVYSLAYEGEELMNFGYSDISRDQLERQVLLKLYLDNIDSKEDNSGKIILSDKEININKTFAEIEDELGVTLEKSTDEDIKEFYDEKEIEERGLEYYRYDGKYTAKVDDNLYFVSVKLNPYLMPEEELDKGQTVDMVEISPNSDFKLINEEKDFELNKDNYEDRIDILEEKGIETDSTTDYPFFYLDDNTAVVLGDDFITLLVTTKYDRDIEQALSNLKEDLIQAQRFELIPDEDMDKDDVNVEEKR